MYNRKLVFASACLGMFVFGVVMTVLGAVLPSVITQYGMAKAEAGTLFSALTLGVMAGSVFFGPVVDRYGYRLLLFACTLLVLAGLEGIAYAGSLASLYGSSFLIGLGGGVLNGATNALVADISEEGRSAGLSLLGVFYGIGAFGIPFIIGNLLGLFTYTSLVAAIGGLTIVPLVFFALVRFPAPKQPQGLPLRKGARLLKDPVLLLMGLVLFMQSGMETTGGAWTSSFFKEVLDVPDGQAVVYLSLFWAGMMIARLVMGLLLRSISPAVVLKASLLIALLGAGLLLTAQATFQAAPGIFLLGAGLGATYPLMYGYAADRYPDLSGTAFGILLVIALIGGSTFPVITGALGNAFGMRASFLVIPISLVCVLAIFSVILEKRLGARSTVSSVN